MDNREKILARALDLFARRGYEAVGVQEVADASGLGKPTLYHYFGSKGGLLSTLLDEKYAPFFAALEQAAEYRGDITASLQNVTEAYFDFARKNPRLYRLQLAMWFAPPDSESFRLAAGLNGRQQQVLEALFLRASADHGNMKGRQQAYAATFLGTVNTYASLGLIGTVRLDGELVYKSVHQFMHGIFS